MTPPAELFEAISKAREPGVTGLIPGHAGDEGLDTAIVSLVGLEDRASRCRLVSSAATRLNPGGRMFVVRDSSVFDADLVLKAAGFEHDFLLEEKVAHQVASIDTLVDTWSCHVGRGVRKRAFLIVGPDPSDEVFEPFKGAGCSAGPWAAEPDRNPTWQSPIAWRIPFPTLEGRWTGLHGVVKMLRVSGYKDIHAVVVVDDSWSLMRRGVASGLDEEVVRRHLQVAMPLIFRGIEVARIPFHTVTASGSRHMDLLGYLGLI